MISPLKTWQHKDPKGLWPALGGLAVLAHVGAIGASVPYLLSWQASSEQGSAIAIPIELVATAPIEAADLARSAPDKSDSSHVQTQRNQVTTAPATASKTLENTPNSQAFDLEAIPQSASITNPSNSSLSNENKIADSLVEQSNDEQSASNNSSPSEQTSREESQIPNESEEVSDGAETNTPTGNSQSSDTSSQSVVSPQISPKDKEPSTIEGDNSLPAPSTSNEAGQSLQLRVVGTPRHDPISDFESAPPELSGSRSVEIDPNGKGCRTVGALATGVPLIYRIGVNEDGTIYSASLQSGQFGSIAPADDEAMTCLIVNSGITFELVGDRASRIDDSLLITFELSEQ